MSLKNEIIIIDLMFVWCFLFRCWLQPKLNQFAWPYWNQENNMQWRRGNQFHSCIPTMEQSILVSKTHQHLWDCAVGRCWASRHFRNKIDKICHVGFLLSQLGSSNLLSCEVGLSSWRGGLVLGNATGACAAAGEQLHSLFFLPW